MMDRLFGRKKKPNGTDSNGGGGSPSPSSSSSPGSLPSSAASSSTFGLPPLLSSSPVYLTAVSHINRALAYEDSCHFTRSMEEYDTGLQLLFSILKTLPRDSLENERTREVLRGIIERYMTRAENAKKKKNGIHHPQQSTAPSLQRPQSMTPYIEPSLIKSNSVPGTSVSATVSSSSSSSTVSPPVVKSAAVFPPLDPALRASIEGEILTSSSSIRLADVIGLDDAKAALHEMIVLPSLRPDLFTGVRAPPKGLLLYGPPGTGKTYLARACAAESGCTFFSISASSLMSSRLGDGEKLVRALFQIARERAPSIIFVDEIDSLLSRRSSDEHEASRRLKTEFLIQLDGANAAASAAGGASQPPRVALIAATNCPEQLDEAFIRRMQRRIYIPMPDEPARLALLNALLTVPNSLTPTQLKSIAGRTSGYSNADLTALVQYAALSPLRGLAPHQLLQLPAGHSPPITMEHFDSALAHTKPSVSQERLSEYGQWAKKQEGL